MTVRAEWNGTVLAESEDTVLVEGNHDFPPEAVRWEHLVGSQMHTVCLWKGLASYYKVTADGVTIPDAAWYYPRPSPLAAKIKNYVAFWRGVDVRQI
jgi:uncharacterized protein (DUF427 family)